MNSCSFIGRLTKEPELKKTSGGKDFTSFSLAVDRGYKDSQGNKVTDFIPCIAFEGIAKTINTFCKKGDLVGVVGRLESRIYEDNGVSRTSYSVSIGGLSLIGGSKRETTPEAVPPVEEKKAPEPPREQLSLYDGVETEEEGALPFDI